jgi:hypothetical protein
VGKPPDDVLIGSTAYFHGTEALEIMGWSHPPPPHNGTLRSGSQIPFPPRVCRSCSTTRRCRCSSTRWR